MSASPSPPPIQPRDPRRGDPAAPNRTSSSSEASSSYVSGAHQPPGIRLVPYSPPRLHGTGEQQQQQQQQQQPRPLVTDPGPSSPRHHESPVQFSPRLTGSSTSQQSSARWSRLASLAESQLGSVSESPPASRTPVGSPTGDNASANPSSASLVMTDDSLASRRSHQQQQQQPSTLNGPRPLSRRHKFVAVHSDKTFSLVPLSRRGGHVSPVSFSTESSHEGLSSDALSDDRPSSPPTTLPDPSPSPCTSTSSATQVPEATFVSPLASTSSPWNYRLVGGLRKVPKSPDLKQPSLSPPTALPLSIGRPRTPSSSRPTFESPPLSLESTPTDKADGAPNYRVLASSSPDIADPLTDPPSSSDSNYQLLARSSPPEAPADSGSPGAAVLDQNYILHDGSSPSPTVVAVRRRDDIRHQFSQESLRVSPLRSLPKKSSFERLSYFGSRSKESLRSGSLASISTFFTQDALQTFLSAPVPVYMPQGPQADARRQDPWAGPSSQPAPKSPMQAHPHQWSSQLSTVPSESEDSDNRSLPLSVDSYRFSRRSSGFLSQHSRQLPSIDSSLQGNDDRPLSSRSLGESLDVPGPIAFRSTYRSSSGAVNYQDEHGDGLGDLRALQQRPSRNRLSTFFSNTSSDRGLASSSSSRANSFSSASLPAWARLYYGGGERRLLAPSSESLYSAFRDSAPESSADNLNPNMRSQRRRPREVHRGQQWPGEASAQEIYAIPVPRGSQLGAGLRRKTSSIWSPHLRHDRRASRYSIWDPPSLTWSAETSFMGRRNIQVVCFLLGFIFPFSWMVASLLPLPPSPSSPDMTERGRLDDTDPRQDFAFQNAKALAEARHDSARWWRQLNRWMSLLGILVIVVVVVLVVLGLRQGWGSA